jgi:hypothetical protein
MLYFSKMGEFFDPHTWKKETRQEYKGISTHGINKAAYK